MKVRRILAVSISILLMAVILPGVSPVSANTSSANVDTPNQPEALVDSKSEVVYARLGADGSAGSVYIVNQFDLLGTGEVVDYGAYESVQNLTNLSQITKAGDAVTFMAEGEKFYYQGNMRNSDLPWTFDISYYLDGQKTNPKDIAGKSGNIEIRIKTGRNQNINQTFYDNYMLQITVTLDTSKCKDIDAPKAVSAISGKDSALTYTIMPGEDADISIFTEAIDFTMTEIQIAGVPYSMEFDMPNMDEKLEDLDELPDAISKLHDGVGDLADGSRKMKDGANDLVNGSTDIQTGLSLLGGNSGKIISGSKKINDSLAKIAGGLSSGSGSGSIDMSQLNQLVDLPPALRQLADGLQAVSDGLAQLKDGVVQSNAALDVAMSGILPGTLTPEQITSLGTLVGTTDPSQLGVFTELANNYAAAQTAKGTYDYLKGAGAFTAVSTTVDALSPNLTGMISALNAMADGLDSAQTSLDSLSQLGQLVQGLSLLATNYSDFHDGLVSYAGGVKTLADSYGEFHGGLNSFGDGVGDLKDGVYELHDGTEKLNNEIKDLPDTMRDEIDNMTEQYLPADFDIVSFASSKNKDISLVQFVILCDKIDLPEEEETQTTEPEPQTFWDKLKALFTK